MFLQDGAHGHQRQRQVQLPPDILQQGGVAPEMEEPGSASFASGAGDAVLLTSTGDDDLIDAQATMHLPSTGSAGLPLVSAHCGDVLRGRHRSAHHTFVYEYYTTCNASLHATVACLDVLRCLSFS